MTIPHDHSLYLVYFNKAMDLFALSINVNEEPVFFDEETRTEMINAGHELLNKLNERIKACSVLEFNRATFNVFNASDLVNGATGKPTGKVMVFPIKIHDDNILFAVQTRDTTAMDYRKVIPSLEYMQSMFDEVRKVTLVRGINFVQQNNVLQRYANRFLQYPEIDYMEGSWRASEKAAVQDEHVKTQHAEHVPVATLDVPWRLVFPQGNVKLDAIESTFKSINPDDIDEEYIIEFYKNFVPAPLVPSLAGSVLQILYDLWGKVLRDVYPPWTRGLVKAILEHFSLGMVGSGNAITGIDLNESMAGLDRDLHDFIKRNVEFLDGASTKIGEFEGQDLDATYLGTFLESFKESYGDVPLLDDTIKAVHGAQEEILKTNINPARGDDLASAGRALGRVKAVLEGLGGTLLPTMAKHARLIVVDRSAQLIEDIVKETVLPNEKGVVKTIGSRILQQATERLVDMNHYRVLSGAETGQGKLVEPGGLVADISKMLGDISARFRLSIAELMHFAHDLLDEDQHDAIDAHIQKFALLEKDVQFLREFIFNASVFNAFIEKHGVHFYDPKSFANLFGEFVTSKIEKLPLEWKNLPSNWCSAFSNVFQVEHAQKPMDRPAIIGKFFDFMKIVTDEQCSFENTFSIMSSYAITLQDAREKRALLEFLKRFEQSQEIREKLPTYFEGKLLGALDSIDVLQALDAGLPVQDFKDAVVKRSLQDLASLFSNGLLLPAEISFQLEKDAKIEFRLVIEPKEDKMSVTVLTNWYRLVEVD